MQRRTEQPTRTQVARSHVFVSARTAGFSVVELLVSISLMLLIFIMINYSLRDYADRQVFDGVVDEVQLSVTEQRRRSLAAVNDTTYGVWVGTSSVVYFSGSTFVSGASSNRVYNLPSTVTSTSTFSDGNWYITFGRLDGMSSATGTIVLDDTRTGLTATLTVSALGLVE